MASDRHLPVPTGNSTGKLVFASGRSQQSVRTRKIKGGIGLISTSRFTFQAHNFDLVHSRLMTGAIHVNRWAGYLRDMLRVLRPGGWAQLVELYHNVQSDNGSLTDDPREYEIGTANRVNVQQFLSSIALYPFAERLEMPIQDVQLLVAQARVEADDPRLKVKAKSRRPK
ncbi:hypothetical protein SS1G_01346 [Sclerotinia sclerotiorum 1980 UF-70]|uniref:Methyltransferase type 11 domain-containing protein n=1 Tax=Sclerotinia sclerotiorum (strain ATCC 18683 / 1980 / Ss-1) TaxID=665079 RepID=A7E7R8_SCLS1|nr:hypothetical protein SS1G_01346 [Sclerotinia sclerotiorum 1980 UF-70]EDN96420.1 hypothetical protein SS1G_01346 [Sclerotinia sclerotiorum 1980 UF-70]